MSHRSVVIHGHYYQPPREDPWLEEVDAEASAAPFHDWNARIEYECYRAVVAARVLDDEGRIERVINTLAYTSFDFGPTLFEWMERAAPATYAAVLDADRQSAARLGHGNAIAQPYHHVILPLASRRDKVTEVRWGIADFRRRFGRAPEGMWLPETAVDDETLDVLAEHGIRFTVLAPHQIGGAPADGHAGLYRTAGGREIALFAYDGGISHGIAFGGLLRDAAHWVDLMAGPVPAGDVTPALVSAATDGETYGHHHKFGDMALAHVIDALDAHPHVRVENYASFLARHPAVTPVTLVAPSAWSCSHGVERWRSDCGCRMAAGTQQRWRAPLREAVTDLATELHGVFEREGGRYFRDVWAVRNWYGEQPDGPPGEGVDELPVRARELLEMERGALRMATSCAWFFDDIGGLEPLQVLRYAAHAVELAGPEGAAMEQRFLARMADAESNDPAVGTGRAVYVRSARPQLPHTVRAAAGYAVVRRFGAHTDAGQPSCCAMQGEGGVVTLRERRTGRRHAFDVVVDVPGRTPNSATPTPMAPLAAVLDGLPLTASTLASSGVAAQPEPRTIRRVDADVRAVTVLVRPVDTTTGDGGAAGVAAPLGVALKLADLPERARRAVELKLRRERVLRLLGQDALERLAAGEAPLHQLAAASLTSAVHALARDTSPTAVGCVLGLADLVDSLQHGTPFDAQSAFHAVRVHASPADAERLAPVARRLGFSDLAWGRE